MDSAAIATSFCFSRWQVSVDRRLLVCDGRPVVLSERSFDILVALLMARGTVLTKEDLIRRAWPGRVVEENTVEAHISALRRALGQDKTVIRTLSGRGYQFVGELTRSDDADTRPAPQVRLPVSVTPLIGRDQELQEIVGLVSGNRLVTLVGAGGVGKTRLALEVARRVTGRFADGVALAELGPLGAAHSVAAVVAQALGFPLSAGTPSLDRIASSIRHQRALLVLDNCEHLIDSAAQIAETVLHAGQHLAILATSREALKADGEYVYRVPSLEVPREDVNDPADIMRCGALQLFEARAPSLRSGYPSDLDLAAIKALICRRLDGIPLAIELAAARVRLMGVRAVAEGIADRFGLLTGGARTALPRHRTLRATLDWSYLLLTQEEQQVLGRLSVFSGSFVIDSALAVAASADVPREAVREHLLNLVEKSLVSADPNEGSQYRLLETTRVYAREKLNEAGELQRYARCHARHFADLMKEVEKDWSTRPSDEWATLHAPKLENVRTAIHWCMSEKADPALGIELTVSTLPLWLHLALLEECLSRVEMALALLGDRPGGDEYASMKLHAARAECLLYQGVGPKTGAAFERALELAEQCDDLDYRLRAQWGLWSFTYINGEYVDALSLATQFRKLAARRANGGEHLIGERMEGLSLFCLGRLTEARHTLEGMLKRYTAPAIRSHLTWFIYDQRMLAQTSLAQALWLLGFAEKAMTVMQRALEEVRATNHAPSLCHVLTECVCPLTLLTGGAPALGTAVAAAVEATCRHGVSTWKARGRIWMGLWRLAAGDATAYEQDIRPGMDELGDAIFVTHYTGFVSALCEELGRQGDARGALALIERAIRRARKVNDSCSLPELLRVEGMLLTYHPDQTQNAEQRLVEAFEISKRQESVAWQLRCATSLARLMIRQNRSSDARALLTPILRGFSEGFDTADLRSAQRLLAATDSQASDGSR